MVNQKLLLKEIVQIGFVVKNVEEIARRYWDDFGIGPWTFYMFNSSDVKNMAVHGKQLDHAWRAAAAKIGNIQLELIEPLDDNSIYAEYLKKRGEGIHHVQFSTDDHESVKMHMTEKGYQELGSGVLHGIPYSYFDTEKSLALIAETIGLPALESDPILPYGTYP
jgi:methylmalonyl-CoA/ethylmalonyl-CoA epimerase